MTLEELKSEIESLQLPKSIRLSEWEYIGDTQVFLNAHFQLVEQAGARYAQTPAWERLIRFREVVTNLPV